MRFQIGDRVQIKKIIDGEWHGAATITGVFKTSVDGPRTIVWYNVLWDGGTISVVVRDARLKLIERPFTDAYRVLLPAEGDRDGASSEATG